MQKISHNIDLSNLQITARYIVYLSASKFEIGQKMGREIISYGKQSFDKNSIGKILAANTDKFILLTNEDNYLQLYLDENIDDFKNNPTLSKIAGVKGEDLCLFDEKEKESLNDIVDFCLNYLNDLIVVTIPNNKVFISRNSYYLTNFVTDEEKSLYPIAFISDEEILHRISVEFNESVNELFE